MIVRKCIQTISTYYPYFPDIANQAVSKAQEKSEMPNIFTYFELLFQHTWKLYFIRVTKVQTSGLCECLFALQRLN